ncbi:MAG: aquaporin family protein [Negativicutes bacterium]|nr:aquaporin family protein [Negativicutes bacterium]
MGSPLLGEFLGTMILIVFGSGVVANVLLKHSKAENGGWIVIVTGWAMGVMLGVFTAVATGSAQADLNPAVTLAKLYMGIYRSVAEVLPLMLAQLAGGFAGGVLVWLHFRPHWQHTNDKSAKLAVFCTAPAIRSLLANLWSEVFGTFILVFCLFAIFFKANGVLPPGLGPYMVGMLVWAIGLSLGGTTGYAINPARDLGPRLAHAVCPVAGKGGSDWGYAWVPVVGPMLGSTLAYLLGRAIGFM